MKSLLTLGFLLSSPAFASAPTIYETLYSCRATKWYGVSIVKESSPGVPDSYSLVLETFSRDPASVGHHVHARTPLIFGLTRYTQGNDGTVTFVGDYIGSQPANTSTTLFIGKATPEGLAFEIVAGPHQIDADERDYEDVNYSHRFFRARLEKDLFGVEAVENGKILCTEAL